jgi:hypothetical protein
MRVRFSPVAPMNKVFAFWYHCFVISLLVSLTYGGGILSRNIERLNREMIEQRHRAEVHAQTVKRMAEQALEVQMLEKKIKVNIDESANLRRLLLEEIKRNQQLEAASQQTIKRFYF